MDDVKIKIDPAAIEEELGKDVDGVYRDATLALLAEQSQEVKKRLDAGVSPAEFEVLDGIHKALAASDRVVKVAWRRLRIMQMKLEEGETK